jgi:hypothetical protein
MERVGRGKTRADQLLILRQLALNPSSVVSHWAILFLVEMQTPQPLADPFLHDLVGNTEIAAGAFIALDEALERLEGSAWLNNDERLRAFINIVSKTLNDVEMARLSIRILEGPRRFDARQPKETASRRGADFIRG